MTAGRLPHPPEPGHLAGADGGTSAGYVVQTDDGHLIGVEAADGRVCVDWLGPARAELTPETAATLGYVLRSYARLAEQGDEPAG